MANQSTSATLILKLKDTASAGLKKFRAGIAGIASKAVPVVAAIAVVSHHDVLVRRNHKIMIGVQRPRIAGVRLDVRLVQALAVTEQGEVPDMQPIARRTEVDPESADRPVACLDGIERPHFDLRHVNQR